MIPLTVSEISAIGATVTQYVYRGRFSSQGISYIISSISKRWFSTQFCELPVDKSSSGFDKFQFVDFHCISFYIFVRYKDIFVSCKNIFVNCKHIFVSCKNIFLSCKNIFVRFQYLSFMPSHLENFQRDSLSCLSHFQIYFPGLITSNLSTSMPLISYIC